MRAHKVRQGEDLTTIAAKYGISDWEAVYNHAANEPRTDSKGWSFEIPIPIAIPTKPSKIELPTCPNPHKAVIQLVLVIDQFLALAITINGT